MKCAVIVVAAGRGRRFKSRTPKTLAMLGKSPLIVHGLTVFERCINIDGIVIVAHGDHLPRFKALGRRFGKVIAVVRGGATRSDSVKRGMAALAPGCRHVLIHDAARPFVDAAMVARVIRALRTRPAVITAVLAKATIKEVDAASMTVRRTLPRPLMWEAQTPQGFWREVLERAHAREYAGEATDDALLVERLGVKVSVVRGDYRNLKVTTPEDMLLARALQ